METRRTTTYRLHIKGNQLESKDLFSASDAYVLVEQIDYHGASTVVGKTEQIKNSNHPQYKKSFVIHHRLGEQQLLRFSFFDGDTFTDSDLIGLVTVNLDDALKS